MRWSLLILTVCCGFSAFAVGRLASFQRLEGQFKQTKLLVELDAEIKTEGRFRVDKTNPTGAILHWEIQKPKPSQICIDPVGLVIHSGSGAAATTKNLKFSEMGANGGEQVAALLQVMTLSTEGMLKDFWIEEKGQKMILFPKNEQKSFFVSAEIDLDRQGLVQNLVVKEKTKDEIRIQFFGLIKDPLNKMKWLGCAR